MRTTRRVRSKTSLHSFAIRLCGVQRNAVAVWSGDVNPTEPSTQIPRRPEPFRLRNSLLPRHRRVCLATRTILRTRLYVRWFEFGTSARSFARTATRDTNQNESGRMDPTRRDPTSTTACAIADAHTSFGGMEGHQRGYTLMRPSGDGFSALTFAHRTPATNISLALRFWLLRSRNKENVKTSLLAQTKWYDFWTGLALTEVRRRCRRSA